jgi:hypothetical protein
MVVAAKAERCLLLLVHISVTPKESCCKIKGERSAKLTDHTKSKNAINESIAIINSQDGWTSVLKLAELLVTVTGTESTVTVGTTVTVAGFVTVGVVWVSGLVRMVTGPRIYVIVVYAKPRPV